jgi:hypothetical protein
MSSITVYQCDGAGHYMGQEAAFSSPLEENVFHVPAGCVSVAPPTEWPDGQWPRWNGASWDIVTKPAAASAADPVAKLQAFLAANPDVASILNQGSV